MSWKDILKRESEERLDLVIALENAIDKYGEEKLQEDYESEADSNAYSYGTLNVEITFEDNSESNSMEQSDIFENDEGYYRIEFKINDKELAVADYTYDGGYNVVSYTPEEFSDKDLRTSIEELKDM